MHVQKRRHCKLHEDAGKLSIRSEPNLMLAHDVMAAILDILVLLKFVKRYNFFLFFFLPWCMKTICQKTKTQ